jgi:hypothetical protein
VLYSEATANEIKQNEDRQQEKIDSRTSFCLLVQENDEIGEFLADETQPEVSQFLLLSGLYRKYCEWCHPKQSAKRGLIQKNIIIIYREKSNFGA